MTKNSQSRNLKPASGVSSTARPLPPKSPPNWKPETSGLSRAELRDIVAHIMG